MPNLKLIEEVVQEIFLKNHISPRGSLFSTPVELCSEKIVPRPGRYHTSCRSIFVIFCMVLGNNNRRKITEPDF